MIVAFLTAHFGQFDIADIVSDRPERGSRFYRLELTRVADENGFGAELVEAFHDAQHLCGRDHSGLVDNEHIALVQLIVAPRPSAFPRGERFGLRCRRIAGDCRRLCRPEPHPRHGFPRTDTSR